MIERLFGRGQFLIVYLRPQRWRVVALAVLLFTSIGLQLLIPQILRRFIDSTAKGGLLPDLITTAILFIVVALIQQICGVGATYYSENVGWTATNALRADLLLHCLRLDQSFHKTRTPGELIERIDGDVTALANFFSQFIVQVLGNILLLAGILIVLWTMHWQIGLLLTGVALVIFVAMNRLQAYVQPRWAVARQKGAELYGFLEERLAGTEDIGASGAQEYTLYRLTDRLREQFHTEWPARLLGRGVWVTVNLLFAAGTAATYILGARLFALGGLTLGTIFSIFFYVGLLWRPLTTIAQQVEDFQKAGAGLSRVQELLAARSTLRNDGTTPLPAGALKIEVDAVTFGYDADEPVIENLSLELVPGRVIGVLGRTGSGKTTLTRLLQRLYEPQQGTIRIGGVDIGATPLEEVRRRVGVVTQEVQLFQATVRDNMTFFDRSIGDEQVLDAIETLGLRPWYDTLPAGLDTELASGSGGLSAGEGQLLAFTRIFLRNPGLIILDEASSRLDPATEQLIERAMDILLHGRTSLIIAHRLRSVQRADEILILEAGHVMEHGLREALVRDPESRFSGLLRTGLEEALV
jgi:ABC-type multidrug transport system fused ATPase/permease subunit